VFENGVLRRIFGPKRDEVTGEWRKLHNEELHDLYSSTRMVRIIKSRKMRWAGHVACPVTGIASVFPKYTRSSTYDHKNLNFL
jgi:hypothetical protein